MASQGVVFVIAVAQKSLVEAVIGTKGQKVGPEGRLGHGNRHVKTFVGRSRIVFLVPRARFLLAEFGGQPPGNGKGIRCEFVELLEVDDFGGHQFVGS